MKLTLIYATNRNHQGKRQWFPDNYGQNFSGDRNSNLRFGKVTLSVDTNRVNAFLSTVKHKRVGDGIGLSEYLSKRAKKSGKIKAYKDITTNNSDDVKISELASTEVFKELKVVMEKKRDVLINIHGFNVEWWEAVGSAMALELMLNRKPNDKGVTVFLFSWPSNGDMMKGRAYASDTQDAIDSGIAVARGFLKLRDFLMTLKNESISKRLKKKIPDGLKECGQDIHLLCHSMGNFVLQNALNSLIQEDKNQALPRLFKNVFMCSPDVSDTVFECARPMNNVHQLCRHLSVYFNRGDLAMYISEYSKSNSERLGHAGAARPAQLHNKIHQVDCSDIVKGVTEHSYYLWATVNDDIRQTIDGYEFDNPIRNGELTAKNSAVLF